MSIVDQLIEKTGEQVFSICLLVSFAFYCIRKQQKTDDRLSQYIAEDRKEMMSVIENNTRVMEQIVTGGCGTLSGKNPRARNRSVNA